MHWSAQETKHDIILLRASNTNLINRDSKSLIILFAMSQCKKKKKSFRVISFRAFEISPVHPCVQLICFFLCQLTPFKEL